MTGIPTLLDKLTAAEQDPNTWAEWVAATVTSLNSQPGYPGGLADSIWIDAAKESGRLGEVTARGIKIS
jgi:hypothetical protein